VIVFTSTVDISFYLAKLFSRTEDKDFDLG